MIENKGIGQNTRIKDGIQGYIIEYKGIYDRIQGYRIEYKGI